MQNRIMTITVIRSIIIYITIVIAVRIMGKRQIGELKPHELVITILISAVATIPIEQNTIPLANSILPILIFVSFEMIESAISMKSIKFRDLIQGKPIFIIKNGTLQQNQLNRLRFTLDDLIDASRQAGAFDISQIENAVVETNGTLSVQLKSEDSPVTPSQMKLKVDKALTPQPIAMDSQIVTEYFGKSVISKSEIELYLTANDIKLEEVMLLTIDDNGQLYLIRKDSK